MIRATSFSLMSAAGLVALTACAPLSDPNNPNRQAQTGALVGAGVGALAGALTAGDDPVEKRQAVLTGAAIGAAGGAVVGNQLDRQEAALRQQVGNNNIDIQNTGDRLIVTLPQDILFATDSTAVSPSIQGDLIAVARNLQQYPDTNVQVIGHTDSDGDASYNLNLSQRRAQAVSSILISNGVPSFRVQSIGRGEDQPVASNLTPEGKAQNRRVEIVILPTA